MESRPRVLLVAEAANPEWASVPLVGWNLCRALRDVADVTVVTQVRNRAALERAGWRDGREFVAIDSEAVAGPVWRFTEALQRRTGLGWTASTALSSIAYYQFEHLLWRRLGDAVASGRFDVVHRVTPLSPTIPSVIAARCRRVGVPFVWGPINGGVAWPREFADLQRKEGEWLSRVRGMHRLMPGYRSTRRHAAAILAGSMDTLRELRDHADRCVYLPENGIDPDRFPRGLAADREGPLRVAFIGRLVPLKGVDMLVEAVAPFVRKGRVTVEIVGDGPERQSLERQVQEARLGSTVTFHGWVENRDLARRLAGCEVLAFPSIKDFGGGVVLEGMAMGLVPVVVDHGGPAELVSPSTGFRVPLGPRERLVAGFRDVLERISRDRAGLRRMADRGRDRVLSRFTWDAKARQVASVYEWVLGRGPRPDFGAPFPDDGGGGPASAYG